MGKDEFAIMTKRTKNGDPEVVFEGTKIECVYNLKNYPTAKVVRNKNWLWRFENETEENAIIFGSSWGSIKDGHLKSRVENHARLIEI